MTNKAFRLAVLLAVLALPAGAFASLGVGVGSGKISIDQRLNPGGIYELPALPVLNTGDQPADYGVSIEFNEVQSELKPTREMFSFSPATFHLEPGKSQVVRISLNLPVKTAPGNYFAYIEAHPVQTSHAGQATIGVAAAAKLNFTVAPANIFQGAYYRALSFMTLNAPWTYVGLAVLAAAVLVSLFRKFFKFSIGVSRK